MKEGTGWADWDDLISEFDAWQAQGRIATLWWRDDDATGVTGALENMLEISENTHTPLALAVIPARVGAALRDRLADHRGVGVLQHGFAHLNHEPDGGKKSEFGGSRNSGQVETDIAKGLEILSGWPAFLPVFVPPWNRMDRLFLGVLPKLGITAISGFKARSARNPVPGLLGVNSHVDIIRSRDGGRHFIGVGPALHAMVEHLSSRRRGRVDRDEPTGILTHHLDHDDEGWNFLKQVLGAVGNHPAAQWLSAADVFNPEPV